MTALTILVTGTLCIACFYIGAKVGQTASQGEKIEIPTINPMKIIQERQEKRATEEEKNRIDTILRNIDTYDGTALGQQDVPR